MVEKSNDLVFSEVAIIGSGISGLIAAKHCLDNNLSPIIFEKENCYGGLWARKNKDSGVFPGLTTNTNSLIMTLPGIPVKKPYHLFQNDYEIDELIEEYAKVNDLIKHIKLNSEVLKVKKNHDNYEIKVLNKKTNNEENFNYKFCIIASGLHQIPKKIDIQTSNFKGAIIYGNNFRLDHKDVINKRVVVVGNSFSAQDICAKLVGKAESIVNIFPRPYFNIKRLITIPVSEEKMKEINTNRNNVNNKKYYHIIPSDAYLRNRKVKDMYNNNPNKINEINKLLYTENNPNQSDKNTTIPDLYYDVENCNKCIRLSLSDQYYDFCMSKSIIPKKTKIKALIENKVICDDDFVIECDTIILCLGFEVNHHILDEDIKSILQYDHTTNKIPYLLYKHCFHPKLPNLGFVGQTEGLFLSGFEIQSYWIANVFSKKLDLPSKQIMIDYINSKSNLRQENVNNKKQFPFGCHTELMEELLEDSKMIDLKEMEIKYPGIYETFSNNYMLAPFYSLGKNKENDDHINIIKTELDNINNAIYEFNENESLDFHNLKKKLTEKFGEKFVENM